MENENSNLSTKRYSVTVYEVRQRVVNGEGFTGQYSRTVTLSDGTERSIELRPVLRKGEPVIELNAGGQTTYSNIFPLRTAATTSGTLMVHIVDLDDLDAAHAEWRGRIGLKSAE